MLSVKNENCSQNISYVKLEYWSGGDISSNMENLLGEITGTILPKFRKRNRHLTKQAFRTTNKCDQRISLWYGI